MTQMRISLKNFIAPRIPLAVLMVSFFIVLWMSAFFGGNFGNLPSQNSTFVDYLQNIIQPNTLLSNLIGIGFTLLNAFLIAQINNRFTIIRTRTFLPIFVFLLLMGSWNETHIVNGSHLSLTLFIFSLFHFLNMYRDPKASEMAFTGSMFIGVASLIINPLIFLLPVFWLGFVIFQSFSLRTFLATILGLLAPWIIYLSIFYFFNQQIEFSQLLHVNFNIAIGELSLTLPRIIYIAIIILIMIICIFGMYSITNSDAIRTRNNLNFSLLLIISVLILCFIYRNQLASFLPIIALLYALIVSHPFSLKTNNFYGILFIIFIVINIAYVISKYFFI
jgi:hypothetical protein